MSDKTEISRLDMKDVIKNVQDLMQNVVGDLKKSVSELGDVPQLFPKGIDVIKVVFKIGGDEGVDIEVTVAGPNEGVSQKGGMIVAKVVTIGMDDDKKHASEGDTIRWTNDRGGDCSVQFNT